MREAIRVLIAGDDQQTCWLLRLILQHEKDIAIVGNARNGRELCTLVPDVSPDVVLLDLEVSGQEMLAAIKTTRLQKRRIGFVGLIGSAEFDKALLDEVDVLLHKKGPIDRLSTTLRVVGIESGLVSVLEIAEQPPEAQERAGEVFAAGRGVEDAGAVIDALVNSSAEDGPLAADSVALRVSPFGSFRSAGAFQKALEALDGVRGVKVRHFHQGTLYQVVQYEGDIPLEERLKELVPFSPKVVASRPGVLEVRVEPGEYRILEESPAD